MKLQKKKNLKFKDGRFLTKKGKVVGIDPIVARQLEELDELIDRFNWLKSQPEGGPSPSMAGWRREQPEQVGHVEAETPLLDKKLFEAHQMESEMNKQATAEKINAVLKHFDPLLRWLGEKKIFVTKGETACSLHLPLIGNPLDLDGEKVVVDIAKMVKDPVFFMAWGQDCDGDFMKMNMDTLSHKYRVGLMCDEAPRF